MFESTMVPTLLYDARSGLPLEVLSTSNIYVSAKVRRFFRKSKYFSEKTRFFQKWDAFCAKIQMLHAHPTGAFLVSLAVGCTTFTFRKTATRNQPENGASETWIFVVAEVFLNHRGETSVPPRWNSSTTTVGIRFHRGGNKRNGKALCSREIQIGTLWQVPIEL